MAYTVKIGTFAKNIESTAQPTTTGWAEYTVTLKDGADISNPEITLSATYSAVSSANYATMFGRYYWITRKNMIRENLCVMQLEVDVLATYKSEIGSSSLYILRASASYDGNIRDNLYPPTANVTYYRDVDLTHEPLDYSNGYYLLNIAGTQSGNGTLIQLSPTNYKALIADLYTQIDGFQLSDVISNVVKSFGGNPQRLISSIMWFPFPFVTPDDSDVIYIGSYLTGVMGDIVVNPLQILDNQVAFTVRKHPQAASRGQYLNLAPYMNYSMFLPGAGAVNLDTTQLIGVTSIYVSRLIDGYSGQVKYMVVTGGSNSHVLANVTGQWGVPVRISGDSTGDSIIGGTTATLGSALLAAASGGAGAIIGAATGAIGTIAGAMQGASYSNETGGGIVNLYQQPIRLDTTAYGVTPEDNTRRGRPYCRVTTPSSLTGFMIADRGDVVMSGPLPEHEKVKAFLESGFYYE